MVARHVLILRLYPVDPDSTSAPVFTCEDPGTGEQRRFSGAEELWGIVQGKLARPAGSRTSRRSADRPRAPTQSSKES